MTSRSNGRRATFERRHYRRIAEALAAAKRRPADSPLEAILDLQEDLADLFAADNDNFQRSTFRRACGDSNGHDFKREAAQ